MVNGQASLECLEDRGPDKYKLGCYIRGELLSTKVGTVEKLKEWAVGKKQWFFRYSASYNNVLIDLKKILLKS